MSETNATYHFHAGHNDAGYLPESEPATFANFADAKGYMIFELNYAADAVDSWTEGHCDDDIPCGVHGEDCGRDQANILSLAAEDLNLDNGPEWGETVAGHAWWITPCTEDDCAPEPDEEDEPPVRTGAQDPMAYTYDADHHCPECTARRFGVDAEGLIPDDAEDRKGNPVGAVFRWDEWWQADGTCETLACTDCGAELDTAHAERHSSGCPDFDPEPDDDKARRIAADWHGGQCSALYALASSGTVLAGAVDELRGELVSGRLGAEQDAELAWLLDYVLDRVPEPESDPEPNVPTRRPNPWPKTPSMSRCHFEYLARSLVDAWPNDGRVYTREFVVGALAGHLADTNPRFIRERFVEAASRR